MTSVERALLDLAKAQHQEFARLLKELGGTHELSQARLPGSKLGGTKTLQPETDLIESTRESLMGHELSPVAEDEAAKPVRTSGIQESFEISPISHPNGVLNATFLFESQDEKDLHSEWVQATQRRLNFVAGLMIFLNMVLMTIELELKGRTVADQMGWQGNPLAGFDVDFLRVLDAIFDLLFVMEFSLRIWLYGSIWTFFRSHAGHAFEFIIVLFGLVDFVIILLGTFMPVRFGTLTDPAVVHTLRAANSLRILRSCRLFRGLRVLLKACESFLVSLAWAMVLLMIFVSTASILIGNLLQEYILSSASEADRRWIWQYYGTSHHSFTTMYEITFAGNWPTRVRPVTELVSSTFAIPFFAYITLVSFALIRVITAVFLKDTMEAAQNDSELALHKQMNMKAQYVKKLEEVFQTIDETGEGIITEQQLKAVLTDPHVQAHLGTLDLDVHEGTALFHLLDNGDGEVTLEEFTDGILRCKGPARAVDQVAMHAELRQLDLKLKKVISLLCMATGHKLPEGLSVDAKTRHMRAISKTPPASARVSLVNDKPRSLRAPTKTPPASARGSLVEDLTASLQALSKEAPP